MPMNTLGNVTAEAKQFYELDLLYTARAAQVFYQYGIKTTVPANSGNSVSWRRPEALTVNTSSLTEGIPPASSAFTVSEVTNTIAPYGNYITLSDQLAGLGIDRLMIEETQRLGQNGGETVETLVSNALSTGTTITYPAGISAKSSIAATNPITALLFRKALQTLDVNKTHRFSGNVENDRLGLGGYIAFVHPYVVFDFYNDTEIKNALQYQENKDDEARIWTGYIGSIYGIQLVQSTLCPIFAAAGSGGANVYGTIVIGQNAFGVVDAAGKGKYEMVIHDFGQSGAYDPLNQQATLGWKSWQAPTITNQNFMTVIMTGATNG